MADTSKFDQFHKSLDTRVKGIEDTKDPEYNSVTSAALLVKAGDSDTRVTVWNALDIIDEYGQFEIQDNYNLHNLHQVKRTGLVVDTTKFSTVGRVSDIQINAPTDIYIPYKGEGRITISWYPGYPGATEDHQGTPTMSSENSQVFVMTTGYADHIINGRKFLKIEVLGNTYLKNIQYAYVDGGQQISVDGFGTQIKNATITTLVAEDRITHNNGEYIPLFKVLTKPQYDALGVKDLDTVYLLTDTQEIYYGAFHKN